MMGDQDQELIERLQAENNELREQVTELLKRLMEKNDG